MCKHNHPVSAGFELHGNVSLPVFLLFFGLWLGKLDAQVAAVPLAPTHWLQATPATSGWQWAGTSYAHWQTLNDWPVPQWTPATKPYVLDLGTKARQQATVFTVYQANPQEKEQALWTWTTAIGSQWIHTDQRLADLQAAQYLNFAHTSGQARLSTYGHQYGPGTEGVSQLHLGAKPADYDLPLGSWSGVLAECLVYERALTPTAQRQIESYLALKYGLTLRQDTLGVDYLHGSGAVVWNYRQQADFHHRLLGVGQDANWNWSQRQSTSTEMGSLLQLSIGNPSGENGGLPDSFTQDFTLIMGDNDAPLVWETCTPDYERLQRQWTVQPWQMPAQLKTQIRFDAARWEGPRAPTLDYWLVIDRSGQGHFPEDETTYYPLQREGDFLLVSEIIWDIDGSGSDRFTLLRNRPEKETPALPKGELLAWAYPNPVALGQPLHWQLWLPKAEVVQLKLVNATGQVLVQTQYSEDTYLRGQCLPPASGFYWLHFHTATQQTSLKILVQ